MSKPDAAIASTAGGLRSSATAQPKIVAGRLRSWSSRISRQNPTRLPNSYMVSNAMSRWPGGTRPPGDSAKPSSVRLSPSALLYSDPSS